MVSAWAFALPQSTGAISLLAAGLVNADWSDTLDHRLLRWSFISEQ